MPDRVDVNCSFWNCEFVYFMGMECGTVSVKRTSNRMVYIGSYNGFVWSVFCFVCDKA